MNSDYLWVGQFYADGTSPNGSFYQYDPKCKKYIAIRLSEVPTDILHEITNQMRAKADELDKVSTS